jgi:hypothetical protein
LPLWRQKLIQAMGDATSEFVEGDKQLPGRGERKALLAERMRMGLSKAITAFSTAWDQRKDRGQQVSTRQAGNRRLPSKWGRLSVFA